MENPNKKRFGLLGNQAFSVVNFRLPLLRDIVRRGHQVFALAPEFDDQLSSVLRAEGITPVPITLSRTGLNPLRDARDVLALSRQLKALHLDAILSFAIKPVIYGTLAARWAGIPHRFALIAGLGYTFGPDANSSPKRLALHHTARLLYRTALSQADRVFMQNPDDVEDFARMNIVARDRMVRVNGTGVDLDAWPALPPVTEPITFLLAARLLGEKGIRDYVAAARLVKEKAPSTRFLLLGGLDSNPNGISRPEVESWVAEGLVEWPGHVDVRPWLAQSSVYVLPSYYREGVPRSILEALATGRPIITADTPGCRETVEHGRNGLLVPPKDPTALANAMLTFIARPDMIAAMGAESRRLAETRFDVADVNRQMIAVMGL